MAKEIDERVTPAWKRFGQYSTFLRDQRMPMCLKRKIMNTVILPSMTYGAETWSLTNRQREKLAVTQRSMERSMLGVTRRDKIRNEDLRSRTGTYFDLYPAYISRYFLKSCGKWLFTQHKGSFPENPVPDIVVNTTPEGTSVTRKSATKSKATMKIPMPRWRKREAAVVN
eukprot:gene8867-16484_t